MKQSIEIHLYTYQKTPASCGIPSLLRQKPKLFVSGFILRQIKKIDKSSNVEVSARKTSHSCNKLIILPILKSTSRLLTMEVVIVLRIELSSI